ncbi:MAG: ATP-dependent zinc metalloprotease FtsH, partial [Clostridia bacterium]|nr:ATP-dependent zinc metalloprotease FtsH [Clostridia bacterium]
TSGDREVFLGKDYGSMKNYSENIAADIDGEIKTIITNAYAQCESILKAHSDKLDSVAGYLIENEKADREVFEAIMKGEYVKAEEASEAIAEEAKADTAEE